MREREYPNYLKTYGVTDEDAAKRCEEIFETIFHGSEDERLFHPVGSDMGYMEDTGNHDARTEGMSYGMMMSVQMDKKDAKGLVNIRYESSNKKVAAIDSKGEIICKKPGRAVIYAIAQNGISKSLKVLVKKDNG